MDLKNTLQRKVGKAIHEYKMIREGDRIAVGVSGGKDSLTLLDALLQLQRKSPVKYSVHAFTVEQGKFPRPIEPLGEYMKKRDIPWTCYRDGPRSSCSRISPNTAATSAAAFAGGLSMKSLRTWERTSLPWVTLPMISAKLFCETPFTRGG